MGISRFGKRYDEKIAAAKAAEDAERERVANLTPEELAAERVSAAADDWEVTVKVGDALAKSLKVALQEVEKKVEKRSVATTSADNGGWMESNFIGGRPVPKWATWIQIANEFSLDRWGYDVHIKKIDMSAPMRLDGPRKYFFGDDVLTKNSTTPKAYGDWLMRVAGAMYELLSNPWFGRVAAEGNMPGNFKPSVQPDIVREALEQMEHLNVQVLGLEERVRVDEEAEAIASIKRTLLGESAW